MTEETKSVLWVYALIVGAIVVWVLFINFTGLEPAKTEPGRNGNVEMDEPFRTDNGYW